MVVFIGVDTARHSANDDIVVGFRGIEGDTNICGVKRTHLDIEIGHFVVIVNILVVYWVSVFEWD